AARPSWERIEVERLAASFALLPDGALEVLNEAAYARCGAPLLEGDEIIEIEPEILEEMLA
ncbi:MAG TPA: tellurite resistance TerB C-terminal domain-containing protein, partial [Thermoanaerobaculia bacterium]|nr:tellurite resistance TerB C-terminal domain-containing protein [Thermoanaerobaculia bacterium]